MFLDRTSLRCALPVSTNVSAPDCTTLDLAIVHSTRGPPYVTTGRLKLA